MAIMGRSENDFFQVVEHGDITISPREPTRANINVLAVGPEKSRNKIE